MRILSMSGAVFACLVFRAAADEYAVGADVSFLPFAEQNGVVFKDGGQPKAGLQIFKDHGYNWVRLRLFHTPDRTRDRLPNDLAYTIAEAKAAKKLGFKFLLDIHYSDTWADPQKQFIPRAWDGFAHDKLVEAVYAYTRDVVAALRDSEAMPDIVQIGNEEQLGEKLPCCVRILGKRFVLLFRERKSSRPGPGRPPGTTRPPRTRYPGREPPRNGRHPRQRHTHGFEVKLS